MTTGDDAYIQSLERRIAAYLEMHDSVLVSALNHHYKSRTATVQAKLFDLRALTEALHRSNLDVSRIINKNGNIPLLHPFQLNGSQVIHNEDEN